MGNKGLCGRRSPTVRGSKWLTERSSRYIYICMCVGIKCLWVRVCVLLCVWCVLSVLVYVCVCGLVVSPHWNLIQL